MLMTILLIVLVLALVGALPVFSYSSSWGYSPVGIILVILLVALFFGGGTSLFH